MRCTTSCLITLVLLWSGATQATDTTPLVFASARALTLAASPPPATPEQTASAVRAGGATPQPAQTQPQTQQIAITGIISTTLPAALQKAGVPATVARALVHIYQARGDLSTLEASGNTFSVIYETNTEGEPLAAAGAIVAAAIGSDGGTYRAFRQINADGVAQYYDAGGRPYAPAIERTPLDYTIVSSFFSKHRDNPALGVVRRHTGVDLAAPAGTAVHAAAGGTVTFVGWRHGYGRLVKIDHGGGYSTRYAHMAKFASGLDRGDHVRRGETIGYVGESGLATGYHLHFEIRRNGVPYDPLTMPLPDGKPLSGPLLTAFTSRIPSLLARLSVDDATPVTLAAATTFEACAQTGAINAVLALAPGHVEADALGDVFCSVGG